MAVIYRKERAGENTFQATTRIYETNSRGYFIVYFESPIKK